ncbi:aspartyl-phosphate phosphatase Spo0E family protein [Ammoniphilus sp. YIM 78166]|uniref:aspartyl-phosphate phosphatase Spo0E family protein n=1 Tax=Ammoniphilus sp. YIM 78166 TaxID=1644106 RepID=UPI0014318BB9|nr:aspartyl-phosphate phosphatase Spo0E family protein [Ammoniphilus sp. YIM 78166]
MVYVESASSSSLTLGTDALLEEIYFLRRHLNEMSRDVGSFSHPRLVEVSQLLDKKLNDYEQLRLRRSS